MKQPAANILILDDEAGISGEISEFLVSRNYMVMEAARPSEAFDILEEHPVDIALLDIRLPEMSGLEFLRKMLQRYPDVQAIMISGHGDMDSVIQSLRMGALDYLKKPFELKELLAPIGKAKKYLNRTAGYDGNKMYDSTTAGIDTHPETVLVSPEMLSVMKKVKLLARSSGTIVLITGESGTGKEIVAREIHNQSCRRKKPFLAVNCSSIPEELFESEFFGYQKGAFTGAITEKTGWFEAAHKGTLFLDEIGDLKPGLQAKLLRVIEEKKITRLGSTTARTVDTRVIAATNQDLGKLALVSRFRKDLLYRINSFIIDVPPLRKRRKAIPAFCNYFLGYFAKKMQIPVPEIDPVAWQALMKYDFPGNVRELKHMIERALILADGQDLTLQYFNNIELKSIYTDSEYPDKGNNSLENIEKEAILKALHKSGNNKSQASRMLNISRQALDRRISKYMSG